MVYAKNINVNIFNDSSKSIHLKLGPTAIFNQFTRTYKEYTLDPGDNILEMIPSDEKYGLHVCDESDVDSAKVIFSSNQYNMNQFHFAHFISILFLSHYMAQTVKESLLQNLPQMETYSKNYILNHFEQFIANLNTSILTISDDNSKVTLSFMIEVLSTILSKLRFENEDSSFYGIDFIEVLIHKTIIQLYFNGLDRSNPHGLGKIFLKNLEALKIIYSFVAIYTLKQINHINLDALSLYTEKISMKIFTLMVSTAYLTHYYFQSSKGTKYFDLKLMSEEQAHQTLNFIIDQDDQARLELKFDDNNGLTTSDES